MSKLGTALAVALTTTAWLAAPLSAQSDEAIRTRDLCKGLFDATEVTALVFNTPPSAVVLLTGSEAATRLPQQRSASEARYGDGTQTFWIKGDQATWQHGTARALQCRVN